MESKVFKIVPDCSVTIARYDKADPTDAKRFVIDVSTSVDGCDFSAVSEYETQGTRDCDFMAFDLTRAEATFQSAARLINGPAKKMTIRTNPASAAQ